MKNLETERLILKECTLEDSRALFEYMKDSRVGPAAGWKPHESLKETETILREVIIPAGAWTLSLKEGNAKGKAIGIIALEKDRFRPEAKSREMGYSLSADYWGRGLMTEAAKEVMDFAFRELDLEIMCICTSLVNKKSQRIIEKCGFQLEGIIRKTYKIYDGTLRDSLEYSITKEEWLNLLEKA